MAFASTGAQAMSTSGVVQGFYMEVIPTMQPSGLNDGRLISAHLTYAILFCGLGLSDLVSLLFRILFQRTRWGLTIHHLASTSWICVLAYIVYIIIFIDIRISHFNIDMQWFTLRFVGLALTNALATLMLCATMLYRVTSMLKKRRSLPFAGLVLMAALSICYSFAYSCTAIYKVAILDKNILPTGYFFPDTNCDNNASTFHSMCKKPDGVQLIFIILLSIFSSVSYLYQAINPIDNSIILFSTYVDAWLFPMTLVAFLSINYVPVDTKAASLPNSEYSDGTNRDQVPYHINTNLVYSRQSNSARTPDSSSNRQMHTSPTSSYPAMPSSYTMDSTARHTTFAPVSNTPPRIAYIETSRKGSLTNLVPSPLYIDPDEIQPARGDHPPRIDTTRFTLANSRDNLNSHQLHRPTSPTVPVRPQGKLRSGDPHRHRNYPAESLRGALSSPRK
ncbi:hypothetical protein BASA60_002717 [Batrachochytrium salamandrivorans]|nr:hypothetical protein BASA60_002717 [Batrachochytrium salamandrivorans]